MAINCDLKSNPTQNIMKPVISITLTLLFFTFYGTAQTFKEKKEIYQLVLEKYANSNLPIINETLTRIYNYDIDGNYYKWFYQKDKQKPSDTSEITITTICVVPIEYSQSVISFLHSKNITVDDFTGNDNLKLDSLSNYISDDRIISWKKAPLRNSFFRNIFKKKRVIGLSSILFDKQNQVALLKIQVYAKNKLRSKNPSKIIILNKVEMDWKVTGSLDEKQPTKGVAIGG